MKVYGQLEVAGLENLASDPVTSLFKGRIYYNTSTALYRYYDGSVWKSLLAAGASNPSLMTGTRGSPTLITAVGGITITGAPTVDEVIYIAGNGSAVLVSANPQISVGNVDGQILELRGRSASNTVQLADGTGLSLNGGWLGGLDSALGLRWDTSVWVERYRR